MLGRNILRKPLYLAPNAMYSKHTKSCPVKRGSPVSKATSGPTRGQPGKVRFGFVPDEWFKFFYPKTGVSGFYVFALVGTNYLVSKEIYVMEHEYYAGLSIALMVYFGIKKGGKAIGASLDKDIDAVSADWEKNKIMEIDNFKRNIKEAQDSQNSAKGQKMLMDAKKENIAMQLEAAYRERCMTAYRAVKGRMDYHVKSYRTQARIHQKWMLDWILKNVRKSITPQFEQQALDSAIRDLEALASRAK